MKKRLTKAEIEQLDNQIIQALGLDHPQSVRHIFYVQTNPRLEVPVPKTQSGYDRVQRRCLVLRRQGLLPYSWITDTSRAGYHVDEYESPAEFIESVASFYRRTMWTDDLPHVEVWCESRSLAGVLREECRRLAVSLYPCGGFSSATLCYEAATHIDDLSHDEAVVLYVGDFDPAGTLIDRAIEAELRRHLSTPLTVRRLAINREQIAAYDLPTKPRNPNERRRPDIAETVEAEAMPAVTMRKIVREAVVSYLPEDALRVTKVAEESERQWMRTWAQTLQNNH